MSWSFDKKGVIVIDNEEGELDEETVMMDALDAGTALALAITVASRELLLGSPEPPSLTATIISRAILVKAAERLA